MKMIDYDVIRAVIKESSPQTKIYIGCDSHVARENDINITSYCTVVIIHVDGKHGCDIYGKITKQRDYDNIRQRILNETMFAVDVAMEIADHVGERILEIHLDINTDPKHISNRSMKEAVGYCRGMLGLDPILKPNAIAASTCADRFTR